MKKFSLEGIVAAITGAGSEFWVAFCETMAEAYADVACVDVDEDGLATTIDIVRMTGGRGVCIKYNVANEYDVAKMVNHSVETLGKVDILFNNAGITQLEPRIVHELGASDWE